MKLQYNYTTPEQSMRLLELGVPANSADCYYDLFLELGFRCEKDYSYNFFDENYMFIPCWSVGRLIEIFTIFATYNTGDNSLVFNREGVLLGNINCLIPVIELAIRDKCINLSKLEE